jgi:L-rhamnose isomerase
MGYAIASQVLLCLDSGHFHPTEGIADKISSVLLYVDEILLHISRGVRWDSDHVVLYTDDLQAITQEIVRGGFLNRVHIGLDYFDASINRIAAWAIGTRNTQRALASALLEPLEQLKELEVAGDYTSRLVMLEELKNLPSNAVWDYFCCVQNVPCGPAYLDVIKDYERKELAKR